MNVENELLPSLRLFSGFEIENIKRFLLGAFKEKVNKIKTRGAVLLRYFPSMRHRNDRMSMKQTFSFSKKVIFERKNVIGDHHGRI